MEDNNQHKDAEKRTMGTIEVRESDGDEMTLEGYAAVFNSETDLAVQATARLSCQQTSVD
jgi:phage head maturation protease